MGIRAQDGRSIQRPATPDSQPHSKHGFRSGMLQRFHGLFSRSDHPDPPVQAPGDIAWPDHPPPQTNRDWSVHPVSIGLPRQATLRRINSEKKEHLTPVQPCPAERRATSSARPSKAISVSRRTRASSTPPLYHPATLSAPALPCPQQRLFQNVEPDRASQEETSFSQHKFDDEQRELNQLRPPRPASITSSALSQHPELIEVDDKAQIKAELDTKWILNLSMHFRDKSDREKFFVTYAETPTSWRRVTVSCDYRSAESGSLEMDLKELQFQRDKSLQIYESIRDSLPEIQFYDTVTNLKLETTDGRLHVHVTEDVNETIPYPPRSTVSHILDGDGHRPMEVPESALMFDSHLSGFVYKVSYDGRTYIKKEIPGPDTVDEFLYEINALHALYESQNVIQLEAIVVDDEHQSIKGLLISYAERGAIVDLLYDYKGQLALEDRLRWGRDAIAGLSEIHDEGYVQGDFTLSNIVVDADNNAKIIDINRRGCPVGWEPPEIAVKIASHQRISMYIGEKSDLYQLGMTLWGLAADDDEPERHDPPVSVDALPTEVPEEYKQVIRICLDPKPRNRRPARELLKMLPATQNTTPRPVSFFPDHYDFREQKQYINPSDAVEREDIERFGLGQQSYSINYSPASSRDRKSFTYPRSSNYQIGSETSEYDRPRGRAPPTNLEHLSYRERRGWSTEEISMPSTDEHEPQILSVSPRVGPLYDEIELDGKPFLIARDTLEDEDLQILSHQQGQSKSEESNRLTHEDLAMAGSNTSGGSGNTLKHDFGSSCDVPHHLGGAANESIRAGRDDIPVTLNPPTHDQHARMVPSPHPPPSLSYADSGFHEPPDEDEMLPLPQRPVPIAESKACNTSATYDDHVLNHNETGLDKPNKSAIALLPPPLARAETSFKVPLDPSDSNYHGMKPSTPETSSALASQYTVRMAGEDPPSHRMHTLSSGGLGDSGSATPRPAEASMAKLSHELESQTKHVLPETARETVVSPRHKPLHPQQTPLTHATDYTTQLIEPSSGDEVDQTKGVPQHLEPSRIEHADTQAPKSYTSASEDATAPSTTGVAPAEGALNSTFGPDTEHSSLHAAPIHDTSISNGLTTFTESRPLTDP